MITPDKMLCEVGRDGKWPWTAVVGGELRPLGEIVQIISSRGVISWYHYKDGVFVEEYEIKKEE